MATLKPEIFEIESLLGWYDQYNHANYRIYAGHKVDPNFCRAEYSGGDQNEGASKLNDALLTIKQNVDNTNVYLLVLNPTITHKRKPSATDPASPSISFQLNRAERFYPYPSMMQPQYNNNNVGGMDNEIKSRLAAIEAKLMEEDEDEEPEEEENFLAGIFKQPEMKQILLNGIMSLLSPGANNAGNAAVAGIGSNEGQEQKMVQAVAILQQHTPTLGDDLLKLAAIAETDPQQFKFLLSMLRK